MHMFFPIAVVFFTICGYSHLAQCPVWATDVLPAVVVAHLLDKIRPARPCSVGPRNAPWHAKASEVLPPEILQLLMNLWQLWHKVRDPWFIIPQFLNYPPGQVSGPIFTQAPGSTVITFDTLGKPPPKTD